MRVVRVLCVMAVFAVAILEISCGDTFRPIAIPQNPQPPDPKSLHFALVLTANGPETCLPTNPPTLPPPPSTTPCDPSIHPGTSSRIDASGDSNVGTATVGLNPVHVVLLPTSDTAYVANLADNTVTAYASQTAGPSTTTITLPPGTNPVFVETKEIGTVYVAGVGNGTTTGPTVSAIAISQNVVTRTLSSADGIGNNPIAMVETSNGKKLYVVNQGSDNVTAINTVDKSVNAVIPTGTSPIWAVARADDARVYVLNQVSGTVSAIDTVNDVVVGPGINVGAANYMAYDKSLNRLYLTVPATSHLAVLDASADPPIALPDVDLSAACPPAICQLDAVTTLPEGSNQDSKRGTIYVSSYTISGTCTQLAGAPTDNPPCITTQVSVIKPPNNSAQSTITTLHTVFVNSQSVGTKPDVPVVPFCDENSSAPAHARFRRHIAAAADGSRVFVANCDGGGTDIIRTSDDTFVLSLPAPVSSAPALPGQSFPPPQNPVFVVPGR